MSAQEDSNAAQAESFVEVYGDADESTDRADLLTAFVGAVALLLVAGSIGGALAAGNVVLAGALTATVVLFGAAVATGAVSRR